ncbi:multicomponent Na+:H+ antiporter subunit E [Desulfonatronum thiosulfatophilum]|uniref:Multicomponent Na+:H+ antiporter subunit E n=1 Tax=Desulfonatronum thiosulfatophilum TaxID=617002 RepID=A0A1G6EPK0_9BACT|nr:Na+/H+ antiporter subunit E [Desulfonatronum thiosulfatophilum]SDB59182.1 multicomponent Na+:H+ antiporter subunit E [Desulfonatronum thiosulfatophilum]
MDPRTLLFRVAVFGLLWWVLTQGGSPLSGLGIIAILSASVLSLRMIPPGAWNWRFSALIRFGPYFLHQSLLGGLDVAYRALRPRMDLKPVVITHILRLESEPARVFFVWVVSLLPGTAGVDLQYDTVSVHVLDESIADAQKLRELEDRIDDLFGNGDE